MIWIGIVIVTLLALSAVVIPLVRTRTGTPPREAFDRAVYRDQLAEVGRDAERGALTPAEAEAARLEIERRLLATGPSSGNAPAGAATPGAASPVDAVTTVLLAAFVAAGSVALYLAIGSPQTRDLPLAGRTGTTAVADAGGQPTDLAASAEKLKQKLKDNPTDAEGWFLLARTQAVMERYAEAAESYKRLIELAGDRPDAQSGYGEMLVLSAEGVVTPAARAAFALAIKGDPGNLPARYYLALADAQAGKLKEAIAGWQALERDTPPDAPWLPTLRERIAETARSAGIDLPKPAPAKPPVAAAPQSSAPAPNAPRGPTAQDMANASGLSAADRETMIRGMVDQLAARLEQNPDDADGWRRLANAYRVLGETEKAEAAMAKATAAARKTGAPPPVAANPPSANPPSANQSNSTQSNSTQSNSTQSGAPAQGARGPSPQDVANAATMSEADRRTMIRGMVDGLATRLEANPNDAAGWMRLGRAYRMLGENDKAVDALGKAEKLSPADTDILVETGRAVLAASGGAEDLTKPLPERFVSLMKRVETIEPKNAEALWFLGLAEAQQRNRENAGLYWKRLLALLPPESDDFKSVKQAVDALKLSN